MPFTYLILIDHCFWTVCFFRCSSYWISIFFLFSFIHLSHALTVVSQYFEPSHITLGDRFELILKLETDNQDDLVISPFELPKNSGLEVVNKPTVLPIEDKRLRISFPLQGFKVGNYILPPIRIRLGNRQIETPSYKLKIHSVADGSNRIQDIKPPILLPIRWWFYVVWGTLGLAVIGMAIGIWFQRRQSTNSRKIPVRTWPPHKTAYANLERIANSDWIDTGQFKTYYTELSLVIRRYLEDRYQLPFMELPTLKLIASLKEIGVPKPIRTQVETFLQRADLVKFSELTPNKVEAHQLIVDGRKIVGLTQFPPANSTLIDN